AQSWHWTDHARSAAEVRRVLRPGGTLALWWNVTDSSVPWLAAQEERLVRFFGVGPEELGPRRSAVQDRDLPPDLVFTYRRVPWTRRGSLATHLDNLGSHSVFLIADDDAARTFLAEERARLRTEFPDGTVEEAYVVELHAAVR
ncbi:SAM-dependent methyltransferase, partial [Streptomyces rubiginosohelvolus]